MFKLVVLSALIACSASAPSQQQNHYAYAGPVATYAVAEPVATYAVAEPVLLKEYQQVPTVAKVGEFVEHVPSSVSHQSSSVVHSSAAIATPVITPVVKTVTTPIVEDIREAQFADEFHAAPVLKQVQASAHDIVEPEPEIHDAPALAKVGEFVEHVPTSVSHHSSSVVHSSAAIATPVITPVTKTIVVAAPVYKAPELKQVSAAAHDIAYAPVLKQVNAASHDVVEVQPEIYHAPALAKVGEVVEHVPTSVSHQSSSVVHSTAAVATPVITPVTKTYVAAAPIYKEAPLLKTIHAPATYAAPLYYSAPYAAYEPAQYHNEPLLSYW